MLSQKQAPTQVRTRNNIMRQNLTEMGKDVALSSKTVNNDTCRKNDRHRNVFITY